MVDFKLDCDGGMVYISDETGTIITSCIYPPAISRTSYARTTDGSKQWGTTDHPTPGRSNNDASFSVARLEAPVISHPGGMIDGNVSAQVTIPDGATLRYTTDGSTPTLDNGSTSTDGRFDISETTVLRLRLFKDGMLSSPVVTRSFIMRDRNYTLPIVSIVTDDKHIYSQEYGIFVRGVNGRPGNGQSGACNWNMDWERPINFEYFTEDGQAAFNMEVGMEAAGGWSRAWEPHSSNIKANKRYEGLNKMDYPFFSDRPFIREKAIKLRNGGNDTNCRLKDPSLQQVVRTSGLYIETQGWNPVHEFINGHYIGVLNMREPNSKNYGYAVYGLDTDNMDQWKMSPDSGYVQQAGTRDAWEELLSLSSDAADEDTYEQIKQLLDIEEFINYLSVEMYIGAVDWPQNNVKAFRDRNNGRFRFVLFDTDNALSSSNSFNDFTNKQVKTFDQLYGVSDLYPSGRLTLEIEMVTLYLNLLKNATFKKQFIDQFCIVAGSVFEPERAAKVINEMVAHVAPGLELEGHSPNSMANEVRNALSSSRQPQMVSSLRSYMGLRTPQNVTLSSDNENARLFINDLPVPTGKFGGQLFAPITIKATAPAGQRFVGWYGRSTSMGNAVFAMGSQWTYYDQGSLDNEDWTAANYNSAQWKQGLAPLGYNTPDENNERGYQTFLDYGSDVNNKYPTYYFRRQFEITKAKASDQYTLDWVADDGFVIYVNGVEAGRYLMNNTPRPQFGSYADSWSPDNPQSGNMTLDASLFHEGTNTIAVELHNNSASSTDIYWDASLLRLTDALGGLVSTDAEYTLPTSGSVTLVASFEPIPDEELAKSDVHPVKINEISASNDIYINDYQKKNDWIELYNTTSAPIDVAGMYISDNLDKPEKVQISAEGSNASTIIPAHGFLIIWADKLENKDQLHVDFKLAAESGDVVLTAADKSWADTLSYGPHSAQQTVGLYPDGGSMVYVFEQPTINKPNMMSMYAAIWDEPRYDDSTGGIGRVRMDDSQPDNIIFDMTGRRVGTTGSNRKLPHGIYITNRRKILK